MPDSQPDPQLKRWFRQYNQKYFDGGLPSDTRISYCWVTKAHGNCNLESDGKFHIRINPDGTGTREARKFTLLHEMCHVKLWPNGAHGKAFNQEMLRLATAGAFEGLW